MQSERKSCKLTLAQKFEIVGRRRFCETTLAEVKAIIAGSKLVEGILPPATIKKVEKLLKDAIV